jgi:hypothetical protein
VANVVGFSYVVESKMRWKIGIVSEDLHLRGEWAQLLRRGTPLQR